MTKPSPSVERHYKNLQVRWEIQPQNMDYRRLVVAADNLHEPIHRWFQMKESFSFELLDRVVKDNELESLTKLRMLDCFAGSGSSVLRAVQISNQFDNGTYAVGIERDPFLFLVASTKVKAAQAETSIIKSIESQFRSVLRRYRALSGIRPSVPALSTWENSAYFPRETRSKILRIRMAIEGVEAGLAKDILRVCAASTVEGASYLRKDGRALRYSGTRFEIDPWTAFSTKVETAIEDLRVREPVKSRSRVVQGDGRFPNRATTVRNFDLILFSPPYPNNIDYTEVYKAEAWYLGMYRNDDDFRRQRMSTIRSHPSVLKGWDTSPPLSPELTQLVAPILRAIPHDKYQTGRTHVVEGYIADMTTVLTSARNLIADEGRLVFVVGNSLHGTDKRYVLAADLLMCAAAELCGWQVKGIRVARQLHRRGTDSKFLRESVVTLIPGKRT